MKKFLFIPLAALLLAAGCTKESGGEGSEPTPGPGPGPAPAPQPTPVSVWDGKSTTEPADMNPSTRTATIAQASDLAWLSEASNQSAGNTFRGWTFTLGIDIDLADHKWVPISQWSSTNQAIFKGAFHGNGHRIAGLNVDEEKDNCGLFGVTQGAVIKDLKVEGTVKGIRQIGGVCANAQLKTHIENCTFSGTLESKKTAAKVEVVMGGICGWIESETGISNCHSSATIVYGTETNLYAGGVVGTGDLTKSGNIIRYCSFSGKFEAGFGIKQIAHVGGIAGKLNESDIIGSANRADITVKGGTRIFLGGIVGLMGESPSFVIACYNTGAITNNSDDDGLTGGIAGAMDPENVIGACYNTGNITPAPVEKSYTTENPDNYEINFWRQANAQILDCFYKADKPELPGKALRFTASQWPEPSETTAWNIGNDSDKGQFWKSLGTPGTEEYPTLWWEETDEEQNS